MGQSANVYCTTINDLCNLKNEYFYWIRFFSRSQTHFNIQYFCSKPCYAALKQFIQIRYQNQIFLHEMDFTIKPYGYLPA